MLAKVYKHEFKETAKYLVPLNLVLVIMTVVGAIMLGTDMLQNESFELLAISSLMIYMLSIFAIFIVTAVYLTVRYYKTMYSRQGYLTHTLPVATTSTVNVKIVVASFWMLLSTCITLASVIALVAVAAGKELDAVVWSEVMNVFTEVFGMGIGEFIAFMVASVILSTLLSVLTVTASLAIGQLFNQYRILASIIAYIVLYVIQQIIGTVAMFVMGLDMFDVMMDAEAVIEASTMASFYRGTFWIGIITSVIYCAAFYFISAYITKKHLNLE